MSNETTTVKFTVEVTVPKEEGVNVTRLAREIASLIENNSPNSNWPAYVEPTS